MLCACCFGPRGMSRCAAPWVGRCTRYIEPLITIVLALAALLGPILGDFQALYLGSVPVNKPTGVDTCAVAYRRLLVRGGLGHRGRVFVCMLFIQSVTRVRCRALRAGAGPV